MLPLLPLSGHARLTSAPIPLSGGRHPLDQAASGTDPSASTSRCRNTRPKRSRPNIGV